MSRDDFYDSLFGRTYSAYMERPRLNRLIARVLWGGDTRPYYESMNAVGAVPAGGTIVDCPCGAGPVFRAIRPGSDINYIAADLSPAMLRRARARAEKHGLREIRFIETDATAIPVADSSADLFLSYWGLHCFPDPRAAIEEVARVLRPGGRLVGCCFVRGDSLRQRLQAETPHNGFRAAVHRTGAARLARASRSTGGQLVPLGPLHVLRCSSRGLGRTQRPAAEGRVTALSRRSARPRGQGRVARSCR